MNSYVTVKSYANRWYFKTLAVVFQHFRLTILIKISNQLTKFPVPWGKTVWNSLIVSFHDFKRVSTASLVPVPTTRQRWPKVEQSSFQSLFFSDGD